MELSVLDLFSGIGGFSVGLEATGKFKTVAFCEKDKFCQKVLQKHWQDTPIYEDIKKLDGTKIKADVITGGFHANQYQSLENKKEKMMTDSYSLKCLELLKKHKQGGLLERMCKIFLTSQMEKSCKEFTMTWKPLVTKSKLLVFQLVRKEHGTKDQEFGSLLPTPTQDSASERTKKYKQGGLPLTMAVRILPTPTTSEHKYRLKGNSQASKCLEAIARKAGGKLSANFTEFLMGYNMDWTKIELTELKHLETQSYHKSQQKLAKQSLKQKKK